MLNAAPRRDRLFRRAPVIAETLSSEADAAIHHFSGTARGVLWQLGRELQSNIQKEEPHVTHTDVDTEIQESVLRELQWDTRILHANIHVAVEDGVVTLTGTVNSYGERALAQDLAHAVAGVLDVANDIQVVVRTSQQRSDTELAHQVRLALEWDASVPEGQIRSTVANSEVTLDGEVETLAQRDDAERAVHNLVGIRIVTNKLKITPVTSVRAEVEKSLETVLAERAHDDIKQIRLEVSDGHVILSGMARSWDERQALIDAARRTRGVCSVEANLGVEPQPHDFKSNHQHLS